MNIKKAKSIARQSAKERFEKEYPELNYEIGKQEAYNSDKSLQVITEVIIKKQKITYSDTW